MKHREEQGLYCNRHICFILLRKHKLISTVYLTYLANIHSKTMFILNQDAGVERNNEMSPLS